MVLPPDPSCPLLLAGIILCLTRTILPWAARGWAAGPAPSPTLPFLHVLQFHATPVSPPIRPWTVPNPKTTSSSPSSRASAPSGQSTSWDLFTQSWYVRVLKSNNVRLNKNDVRTHRHVFASSPVTVWSRGTSMERDVWAAWRSCCLWSHWWEEPSLL